LRTVRSGGKRDVDNAVVSAREAFKSWSVMAGVERGNVLKRTAGIIRVIHYYTFICRGLNLYIVIYMEMLKKSSSQKPVSQFQPNLAGNMLGGWGFRFVQIKGLAQ